jgi:hypothetical protein
MKITSKQRMLTSLTVAFMSGALVTGTALAQGVGTSAPGAGTSAPSAGTSAPSAGTSAPSTGTSAPSPIQPFVGAGTTVPANPIDNRTLLQTPPSQMSPAAGAATTAGVVPSKQEIPAMAFDKLDPGKRGFVTRADVAHLPGFESAFQQADENNDGRLSQDEFARAWAIYSLQP